MALHTTVESLRAVTDSDTKLVTPGNVSWAEERSPCGNYVYSQYLVDTSTGTHLKEGGLGLADDGQRILIVEPCLRNSQGAEVLKESLTSATQLQNLHLSGKFVEGTWGGSPAVRRAYTLQYIRDEALAGIGLGFGADSLPALPIVAPSRVLGRVLTAEDIEARRRARSASCFAGTFSCFSGIF
jgi:hypothetical protein